MPSKKPTRPIKCKILYSSVKAVHVEFRNGRFLWVPKSIIHNEYYEHDTELEVVLEVETWFLDKYEVNGWY